MSVPTEMREWLEGQHDYFEAQLRSLTKKRQRSINRIRDRARHVKKYNTQRKEYLKLLAGVTKMLSKEDWEL